MPDVLEQDGKVIATAPTVSEQLTAEKLEALKRPFELDEIELLPRYIGKKVQENGKWVVPASAKKQCPECHGYHGFPCVHLSYVGHAGITMRLNEVDPDWNWRPMAFTPTGTPLVADGGLWIWLTVLGKTIPAYGDAGDKKPPFTGAAVKELIGDAIRNGAMRFGVGTYLWSKSEKAKAELTRQGADEDEPVAHEPQSRPQAQPDTQEAAGGPSEAQQRLIHALAKERGLSHAQLREIAGVRSMKELTPGRQGTATVFIEKLKAMPKLSEEELAQKALDAEAMLQQPPAEDLSQEQPWPGEAGHEG